MSAGHNAYKARRRITIRGCVASNQRTVTGGGGGGPNSTKMYSDAIDLPPQRGQPEDRHQNPEPGPVATTDTTAS